MANNLLTGLLAAWRLDEVTGNADRLDARGNGNRVSVTGTILGATPGAKDGYQNLGTDEANRMSRVDDGTFDLGVASSFSVGGWHRHAGNANNPMLAKWDSSDTPNVNTAWLLWHRTTNDRFRFLVSDDGVGTTTEVEAGIDTPIDSWNLITAGLDFDNNEIWIQINADDRVVAAHTTGVFAADVPLTLGWFLGLSRVMGGQDQDETYVWERYITSDEHDAMYDSGTGLFFSEFEGGVNSAAAAQNYYYGRP